MSSSLPPAARRPRCRIRAVVPALTAALLLGACAPDDGDPEPDAAPVEEPTDHADLDTEVDTDPEPPVGPEAESDDEPDLGVELVLTEVAAMNAPTAGAVAPDGTLYLAERAGTVHPLEDGGIGPAVIDLSAETTTDGERGLLGLAFAADGAELYLSFTDRDGHTVVDAVAIADGRIRSEQRRTVFTAQQPFRNHNGGQLQVGPDDLLYLGLGDGGGSGDPEGNGQDLSTPLGSLLRIDPRTDEPYAIPADNPFADDPDALDEIWAYGLRNPWRFSFDRETGDLYVADVGQDAREEVNWLSFQEAAGANFGWNLMEGTLEFAGTEPDDHVPPVHEYDTRGPQGCAITGGYVYRGEAIPQLRGAYLFSDYCAATLRAIVVRDGEVIDEGDLSVGGDAIVSFVEDADGELYVLDLAGAVRRLDPA
jgi:glucose/arabinose dehydrogenase